MRRRTTCERNLDETYVKDMTQQIYYESLDKIMSMIDDIDNMDAAQLINSRVIFDDLLKKISRNAWTIDNYKQEDYDELCKEISESISHRRLELL